MFDRKFWKWVVWTVPYSIVQELRKGGIAQAIALISLGFGVTLGLTIFITPWGYLGFSITILGILRLFYVLYVLRITLEQE